MDDAGFPPVRLRSVLTLVSIALVILLGGVSAAWAGTVGYWYGVQPSGNSLANRPVIAYGYANSDGQPLVASSLKLYVDGVQVPRASYTASVLSQYVYVYAARPTLADGAHTFRIEVRDAAGKLSSHQWSANIVQPPSATWLSPSAGATIYTGRPSIVMNLADNTPATTMTVAGEVHSGSNTGPVVATFGESGLIAGRAPFAPSAELPFGTYFLTARITDAAGNSSVLSGSAARSFTTVSVPAMSVLESCASCHASMWTAHPTPATTDCGVCHPDKIDDHMQGTEYCEDCHYDGWHNPGGMTVTVTWACTQCHTADRPQVPRHTSASTALAHESTCGGCHSGTLIAGHASTPEGSLYANQCDMCHASANDTVQAAIAGESTTCSACHLDGYHADFAVKHESPTAVCVGGGCHATTQLVDIHQPYVGAGARHPEYPDTCSLCHQNTDPNRIPDGATAECATCHPDRVAFHGYETAMHTATLGEGAIALFDNHDGWMGPTGAWMACSDCHAAGLGQIHAMVCATCHPTPRGTFTDWSGNCSQGGCHTSYHASGFDHSDIAGGHCSACHDEAVYQLYADPCVDCHAHPDPGDTTGPTTEATVLSSYVGAARISFDMNDSGRVGIGLTFRRLDGATATTGDVLDVTTAGSHTLEYWSVDQNGNEGAHATVDFTVVPDTTPPTTTSNAKSAYEGPASITLSASDSSFLGVKGTYYSLNGAPVQTGTTISIAQPASGTASYALEYWSDDYSNNEETHHIVNFTVTRDTTVPVSTLSAQAFYRTPTISIPFTAQDSGSGVQVKYYKVDGGPLQSLSTASTYIIRTFSAQGPHSIEYWAVDKVGNIETHRVADFNVDWTQPTVSSNALAAYPDTGANITITAVDQPANGAGPPSVVYRLDGGSQVTTGAIATISETELGSHSLEFWAVDLAGNATAHTVVGFTVGTAPEPAGQGTLRLIWGDAGGPNPNSWAAWTVRSGSETGPVVATGSGATDGFGGGWDGIDDVVVPAQAEAYWVAIQWYDDYWPEGGTPTTVHFPVYVTTDGQLVELHY